MVNRALQISGGWAAAESVECGFILADDDFVRAVNLAHRGIDAATDVLSFPLISAENQSFPEGLPCLLGDVIVSLDYAARQAPDGDLVAEVTRLFAHGVGHLVGFDDRSEIDRESMKCFENALLRPVGLSGGLIARG